MEEYNSKSKEPSAIASFCTHYAPFLQRCMLESGFDTDEIRMNDPTFLRFIEESIKYSNWKIQLLKKRMSVSKSNAATSIELNDISEVKYNVGTEIDHKMNAAFDRYKVGIPLKIKEFMLGANFEESETMEDHPYFISVYSKSISFESLKLEWSGPCFESPNNMLLTCEETNLSTSSQRSKAYDLISQDMTSAPTQTTVSIEELYPSSHTEVITKSKKNYIIGVYVESKRKKMAIKVPNSTCSLVKFIQSIEKEIQISQKISHPAFRRSMVRTTYQNRDAALFDWETGDPISDAEKFSINDFMAIGREIVSALSAMHDKEIIHMNLTCEHIIFNSETKSIKIIGTSSSAGFSCQKKYFSSSDLFDIDLRYIAPEQTSLVDRTIDFRTDFYSLGIVFYRLLAGYFPFESKDAMPLLRMHLSVDPPAISSVDHIPKPILSMISKLLKKKAQDRYQSSKGILHDLDLMISEFDDDKELSSIVLASHDRSEVLLLPQTLFGRTQEFKTLSSAFDRMSENSSELAFVAASSGAGKTALVSELNNSVMRKGCIFTSGKYDSSNSEPYFAIIEAIKNFCDIILLEDRITLAQYRSRTQHAVGDEGKVLTSLIPNLHLLIGNQSDIVNNNGQETKYRFNYVFINFIQAVCSVNTLVFILDDLQWVDPESKNLLQLLIRKRIRNLMLIGIYRDNEIDNLHPVSQLLKNIDDEKIEKTLIKLQNLNQEDVNNLISGTLRINPLKSYDLTALVFEKTKGNPFFVVQTLKSLNDQNLLYFCHDDLKWKWKHSLLSEKDLSGNVFELLTQKILSLDKPTQESLKVASCLSTPFSLSSLRLIVGSTKSVESMVQTGMVLQHKGSKDLYSFVHDKMKQAASSLLPKIPRNKHQLYLYIGKKLWQNYSKKELDENIFEVVNILSQAIEIVKEEERNEIANLFFKAGFKAANLAAFDQAYKYLKLAAKLQVIECWKTHYDQRLKLFNTIADIAYCVGDYVSMPKYFTEIEENVNSGLDLTHLYCLRIKMHNDRREYREAVRIGIYILKKIGETIDFDECDLLSRVKVQEAVGLISKMTEQEFSQMKKMDGKVPLLLMLVYSNILTSAFFTKLSLVALVVSQMVILTFKHGVCSYSCIAFSYLSASLNKKDGSSFRVGKLAFQLHKNVKAKEVLPKLRITFYCSISPFYEPIHIAADSFIESYKISNQVGMIELAAVSAGCYSCLALFSGKTLMKLAEDMDELDKQLPVKMAVFKAVLQSIVNMIDNECENPGILQGAEFDYRCCFSNDMPCREASMGLVQCVFMAYVFYEDETAKKIIRECNEIIDSNYIHIQHTYYIFYKGLAALHFAKGITAKNCVWRKIAEESISALKDLSETAPENFTNKYHLIKAEEAALNKDESGATAHFKEAMALSRKHGFTHEEAISSERAGIFFLSLNDKQQASQCFSLSYQLYQVWGATTKSKQLMSKHSNFIDIKRFPLIGHNSITSSASQSSVSTLTDFSTSTNPRCKRIRFSKSIEVNKVCE